MRSRRSSSIRWRDSAVSAGIASVTDSAAINVWLRKEVMTKLAENGGKVPQELLS
jgi:hypothetical protein